MNDIVKMFIRLIDVKDRDDLQKHLWRNEGNLLHLCITSVAFLLLDVITFVFEICSLFSSFKSWVKEIWNVYCIIF